MIFKREIGNPNKYKIYQLLLHFVEHLYKTITPKIDWVDYFQQK